MGQHDAPEALPPHLDIIKTKSEDEEDEDNVFPGTDFLSVADVVQVTFFYFSSSSSPVLQCAAVPQLLPLDTN